MRRIEILIGLVIAICAATWSLAQAIAPDVNSTRPVADLQYHFAINIPVDWRLDGKNSRPGFISVYPRNGGKAPPWLLVSAYRVIDLPDVHTQADFDRREQGMVEDVGHIIDQRAVMMGGYQASAIIFVTFPPQPNKMVVDIGLVRDGMVYAMSFNGSVKQVLHYFPQLIEIATSLRCKGRGAIR